MSIRRSKRTERRIAVPAPAVTPGYELRRRDVLVGLTSLLVLSPLAASHVWADVLSDNASFTVISKSVVTLTINFVAGTLINVSYTTPSGNNPAAFNNTFYLWSVGDNTVPWNLSPEVSIPVIGSSSQSDQNLLDVSITKGAYLVGYAVGPMKTTSSWSPYCDVVASAFIPAITDGDTQTNNFSTTLELDFVGTASLVYHFAFLPGFRAQSSGAWIGLWKGTGASYTEAPAWFDKIDLDTEEGISGLNGLQIVRQSIYTLALFAEGYNADRTKLDLTRQAANLTFSV